MDFGTLLHVAKKNSENKKSEGKFYNTKFAPPKKETKEKKLSDNIQKFLVKREQEERERQRTEREKLNSLLAMRDDKSKNKIRKMLKVTKSANKSVLDDAINTEHTAVTMQGPEQPDQDDYGYVSTEANAFYQKYIDKVKDITEDKGFAPSRPQSLKDLSGTKERVKAAITKESEEKKNHTRQRSSVPTSTVVVAKDSSSNISRAYSTSKPLYNPEAERREEERKKREEDQKKRNRKPLPPPMDFQALLKLAEKKQYEPIEILPEVKKKKEPERLLTSKEKRELEERQKEKEMRERRKQERNLDSQKERKENGVSAQARIETNGRIPKLNQSMKINASTPASKNEITTSLKSNGTPSSGNIIKKQHVPATTTSTPISKPSKFPAISNAKSALPSPSAKQASSSTAVKSSVPSSKPSTSSTLNALSSNKNPYRESASKGPYGGPTREFPPRDTKCIKPRQFPPPDVKRARPNQQPDMRRGSSNRSGDNRKPQPPKRRILDDDEDEYDSELDDFIDDGDCEEDYSAHIKAIFGYDKSRYRYVDEEDDRAMESNFAQVQREEYISKKIGLQEDLEDMKMEAIEKKRKMLSKKRKISD